MTLLNRSSWHLLCLLLCSLWTGALHAEEETVTLNFVNADIESVVKAVGMISNRNFILDPRVKGTVNIVSSKPVARGMTYQILLSALRLQGFAAIEAGGVTKIVPEPDAKQNFSVTGGKDIKASGDRIVTQVYPLQNESAVQLVPILRPLITPNNSISAYAGTNTLVITDYADNIKRINKIIEAIDLPNYGEVAVIKLQYVSALDLAQTLNRLLGEGTNIQQPGGAPQATTGGDSGNKFIVLPDIRSNSLLIRSDSPARIARARGLAMQLDVAGSQMGNINVVYLRNAEATKLAETLRAILSGDNKLASASSSQTMPGQPGQPVANIATNPSTTSSGSSIQADAQTNSLIITAPDNVYNTLRAVIDKLDARRAQVFVEALIVEVTTDKAAEFGIQWQSPLGSSGINNAVVAGTNFGTGGNNIIGLAASAAAGNPLTPGTGFNLGLLQRLTIGGQEVTGLTALARMLESDANANILSTPNLLTLDNEEAKIIIGKNVPFITGSYAQSTGTTTGATVTPFQTIERRDVGLTLKVKPQVAEGGTVKMQIYQEASSIQDTTNAAGVITNKRSIESTVLVDDGQIIVLGGLIQDDVRDGLDKVPGLGDIPFLGSLFKYETRKHVKTNLMVFLRPRVLRNATAAATLTGDRYDYIRNEQSLSATGSHLFLPNTPPPLLPKLKPQPVPADAEKPAGP
ncbi:MAG: type II secretion system secretin GspD [Sulfurimicrobium sp.]|nr:type II secretion system secretin GspD [Sulfurimicrobium sp.]MDP2198627.1 type II secretion system secretin GspD [Sulfurimicrobium sp.]MDP3686557.1 type II secretion system secretin GspD [Sulfurimicrobium sp.]MDZ7655428.1 type II secretion system secretin GspD [Sulfurimicrobium sp.]